MKLCECDWVAIHFDDRVILKCDESRYPKSKWAELLNLNVVPIGNKHYRVVETVE